MLILSSSLETIKKIKEALMSKYEMIDLGEAKKFLGLRITRDKERKIIRID